MEWAVELSNRKGSKIKKPTVIGTILDLGYCLDLLDYKNLDLLKLGYHILRSTITISTIRLPENKGSNDLLFRELDCAVIETLHKSMAENDERVFDSVRGCFGKVNNCTPMQGSGKKIIYKFA